MMMIMMMMMMTVSHIIALTMAAVQDIPVHTSCVRVRVRACACGGGGRERERDKSVVLRAMKGEVVEECVIFCSQADRGRNLIYFIKKLLCKKEN
jgi:hypothetical protein